MADQVRPGSVFGDEWSEIADLLDLLTSRPVWHADAACREHPELSWFPDHGQTTEDARAVCARCLVRSECASWALDQPPGLPLLRLTLGV